MVNKINSSPSFGSNFVFNEVLYKGINQAKIEARTGNVEFANTFANSLKYLKNDGYSDTFELETRNRGYEPSNRVYLMMDGMELSQTEDYEKLGQNVMAAIIKRARIFSKSSLEKPYPKSDIKSVRKTFLKIQTYLKQLEKESGDVKSVKSDIDLAKLAMKSLDKKLNSQEGAEIFNKTQAEEVVAKLDDIIGDTHLGELL